MRGVKCPYDFRGGRSPTVVDAADTADLDVTISYTGRQVQTWTAPYSGYYYVEAYGAAGGEDASRGGYGGYVKMYTYLNEGTNLYITCGQKGWMQYGTAAKVSADNPTYNGGGRAGYSTVDSQNSSWFSGVGGGATSIALSNHGELKDFANYKNDVLMVAGGGAGGSSKSSGSGGLVLYAGSGTNYSVINGADTSLLNGQFALGSNPGTNDGGGGGGGWIGGKSGLDTAGNSAGGGASFVNTSQNCIPIELVPDYNTKNGYVHITSTDYTGYYTISYDYDGGTANNPISYSVKQDDFTLTAPTKEGYTFTGWTGSNGDTPQKDITIKKGTAENLSFKANWKVNCYMLDLNGYLDEKVGYGLGKYGTADLYVNDKLVQSGVSDFNYMCPYGARYKVVLHANPNYYIGYKKDRDPNSGIKMYMGECGVSTLEGTMNRTSTISFYPYMYTKAVNVTFHSNISSADTQTTSQTFTYGVANQKFATNTFINNGYTFKGWAFAQNTVTADYPDNCIVADEWIDCYYPKVDLYAVWSANSYKVTYDANGGTNSPATQSFLYNSGEKLSTQVPVRTGYKFVGWRSGTAVYKPGDSIPSGTMNLDLKAMWIVNSYQVAFNGNGSTKGTMENECFSYDETKALSKNTYSKNGYSFKNWNTKADGSGTAYSDEQTISKLANGENITASINPMATFNIDGKGMHYDGLEEDNSLTTGIVYKATYTTTGIGSMGFYSKPYGDDDIAAANKLAGKRIVVTFKAKASIPMQLKNVGLESVSTGHISLGTSWNTYYVSGIVPDNWGSMAHAIIFYDPLTAGTVYVGDMSVSIVEPVNLYAQWKPVSWTIKYDANGGTGTMANTKHIYNTVIHITYNAFTRLGYSFNGWYATRMRNGKTEYLCGTLKNGFIDGSEWYEKDKIPSDKTVYKWRDNETACLCTYIDNDVITLHAQWSYNPVSVKVPQILTGNHIGKSQFRVKCDNIVAGNITVEPDSNFNYTQDKLTVRAVVKRKSSSSVIDKNNHSVVYDIVTDKPLTAGCWKGSFNVKLTLTKE